MSSPEAPRRSATYVPPDGGQAVWLVGDTYTVKLAGEQTGGVFSLAEAIVPAGGGPPPHIHDDEDEAFVVLAGELLLEADERTLPAPAGTVLYVPKGTRHGFRNVGATPPACCSCTRRPAWSGCSARSAGPPSPASRHHRAARRMSPGWPPWPTSTTSSCCLRDRVGRVIVG
jgi:mannose-6-phosphate isomerase-like protein (cupin superfamily)